MVVVAGFEGDLFNNLSNELVDNYPLAIGKPRGPGFLFCDLDSGLNFLRVVRHDLRTDAIFWWGDDLTGRCVVFRIGGYRQHHVEREPYRVTLNLYIALLHDIEKGHLNLTCQV